MGGDGFLTCFELGEDWITLYICVIFSVLMDFRSYSDLLHEDYCVVKLLNL